MKKISVLAFCGLISGCLHTLDSKGADFCFERISYPRIAEGKKTPDSIRQTYREWTPQEVVAAFDRSAMRTERLLQRGDDRSVGDLFYEQQIKEIMKICKQKKTRYSLFDSAGYVENVAASLINAAGLRDESPNVLQSIVKTEASSNLTARINFLILSASCSKKQSPLIEKNISEIGLSCEKPF